MTNHRCAVKWKQERERERLRSISFSVIFIHLRRRKKIKRKKEREGVCEEIYCLSLQRDGTEIESHRYYLCCLILLQKYWTLSSIVVLEWIHVRAPGSNGRRRRKGPSNPLKVVLNSSDSCKRVEYSDRVVLALGWLFFPDWFYCQILACKFSQKMNGGSGGGGVHSSTAVGVQSLEWKFSQVFGERTAGEEVQEGMLHHFDHILYFCIEN